MAVKDTPSTSAFPHLASQLRIGPIEIRESSRAMTQADMARVRDDFTTAARNFVSAGFDAVELKLAHDGLLRQFMSPLTNDRVDSYGGSTQSRLRFPLEVLEAVRHFTPVMTAPAGAWPGSRGSHACGRARPPTRDDRVAGGLTGGAGNSYRGTHPRCVTIAGAAANAHFGGCLEARPNETT